MINIYKFGQIVFIFIFQLKLFLKNYNVYREHTLNGVLYGALELFIYWSKRGTFKAKAKVLGNVDFSEFMFLIS